MNILKYKPSANLVTNRHFSHPFLELQNQIDKLFDDVFNDMGSFNQQSRDIKTKDPYFVPNVNVSESSNAYIVTADIPGVDEENIKIEANNGRLSIQGEKKFEKENKEENFYRIERSYGSFERMLTIPEDADENNISAEFKNGVLKITVPRDKGKKSNIKKIEIKKL